MIVAGVEPGSLAERGGLKSGDVILKLNNQNVDDVPDLRNRVAITQPGTSIDLDIIRDGGEKSVSIRLDEKPKT